MNKTWQYYLFLCVVLLNISLCIPAEVKEKGDIHSKGHHVKKDQIPLNPIEENPVVHLKLGKIAGYFMKTRLGKDIFAFRSIRYAKAPVGKRRFMPPEPIGSWDDTYDATNEGPVCIQFSVRGVEDCLVLNVYTTRLPKNGDSPKLPVIAYIHGGAFRDGSGKHAGPQYLLDKGVILVTFNYRLGPLGFISTGDKYAPGNLGLKDQSLALQFIKDNIAAFGGDPNSITIAGQSAGSRGVYLQMMSPMSEGLFNRAIAMSGPAQTLEPYPRDQKALAIKLGMHLNCPTDSMGKMFACLREVPAESFGSVQSHFWDWRGNPTIIWSPVIEPNIPGVERFLTDQPNNLIKSGNFNKVPVLTGVVKNELDYQNIGAMEAARRGDNSIFNTLNKNWYEMAPIQFMYQRDTPKSKHVSDEIKRFYFNNKPISVDNGIRRGHVFSDAVTIYPVHRTASLLASSVPVYFYFLEYEGRYTFHRWSDGKPCGVSHQDELLYVFYIRGFPMITTSDPENETLERFLTIWTSFAKSSQPIPSILKGLLNHKLFRGITWKKLNPNTFNYLNIGNNLQIKNDFYSLRMQFWKNLFPA